MTHIKRLDHVGITVADLDRATSFFVLLGLEVEGTGSVEGEFVETVCAIPGARCRISMLASPGGGVRLELSSFDTPEHVTGSASAMANETGIRNVSFEVADLQAAVAAVATDGYGLVGGIGEYQGSVRMAYVRGPEGIIVSLFEQLG
ncbi:VOC family protein [Aeromicrobium endophyticum]|uniref:VOC family protein n=1 Tax=Aeromicrobium endophyticum TaxID=2292704 RepID=A0A371P2I5_9ACTN|nr:VOC family protein [Aeromicrobium endophyticum]REK70163.1 VOC family protein [Aeromicrobium endophyticum]